MFRATRTYSPSQKGVQTPSGTALREAQRRDKEKFSRGEKRVPANRYSGVEKHWARESLKGGSGAHSPVKRLKTCSTSTRRKNRRFLTEELKPVRSGDPDNP